LLIELGIGATPFISVLKDIANGLDKAMTVPSRYVISYILLSAENLSYLLSETISGTWQPKLSLRPTEEGLLLLGDKRAGIF